ncbi:hypothetical protein PCG10_009230 [Penicillium crustosum]|uniref:NACHT domain-containing protein n=1 Tax=Penicillium crustosum TaxID=36656 RepID=A0A9P5L1R9_PENCR|nr:hypothetical protein PCG10_009230 [Penicillium crustosum]
MTTSSSLIYTGKLGAGKSVLLANIVETLHLQVQDEAIPVAFFFARHDISESLKAQTVLGSIARQLLERVSDLTKPAELLERINNMDPPEKVFALLQSAFPQGYRVFIVIDGIDELGQEERELLILHLHKLQRTFRVSLCVSLRQDANDPLKIGSEHLSTVTTTSIPENTSEIEVFISQELQRCIESKRLIVGDISLLLEIQETLAKFSQGMFLWVALQIESLCAMKTDEAISQALKDLPKGLSETFGRILQRSQRLGHSYQKSILELVTVAQRPLTLEELREALSVAPGDTKWNPARLLNNIHSALACCGSLVIIDEEELTLRLVHHSVKQYLLTEFKDSTGGPITSAEAHARMSDIIVTYLNYPVFDRQLSKFVVPEIKTDETMNGIIRSTRYSLDSISSLALKLLRSQNDSGFNMAKVLAEARAARFRSKNQFLFRNYAMLYWQSHISRSLPLDSTSSGLLGMLFERKALDPVTMTDDEASLLFFRAAETGNLALIEHVISSNPGLNVEKTRNRQGQTALHAATWYGAETTIRFLLLREPTGLLAKDFDKNTPLDLAIIRGHVSLVKIFVDYCDSSVDTTYLIIESLRRHIYLTGSNFNSDLIGEVLLVGARNGNAELIRMFLHDSRVDLALGRWLNIDSINQDGKTALHIATELGDLEVVQLLDSFPGVPVVHATGIPNRTPAQWVPLSRHEEAGELMGQNVLSDTTTNSKIETEGSSRSQREARRDYIPVHYFAEDGDTSMASVVLKSAPSLVHKQDHEGRTPLHLAAMNGHLHLVKLILAIENVDLSPIDDRGYSPRDYAMRHGYATIVRLLS